MEDPMQPLEDQSDRFDWLDTEAEEWRTKGAFIFAADGMRVRDYSMLAADLRQ